MSRADLSAAFYWPISVEVFVGEVYDVSLSTIASLHFLPSTRPFSFDLL